jgi:soluble cytochrome b562
MYMSYCRFEGTRNELRACLSDVEEHVNEEAEYEVSDSEINHFRNMVEEFVGWLNDMALLDEDGEIDRDALEQVCKAMAKSYGQEEEDEA